MELACAFLVVPSVGVYVRKLLFDQSNNNYHNQIESIDSQGTQYTLPGLDRIYTDNEVAIEAWTEEVREAGYTVGPYVQHILK